MRDGTQPDRTDRLALIKPETEFLAEKMSRDASASQPTARPADEVDVAALNQQVTPALADHACIIDAQGILHSTDDGWQAYAAIGYAGPIDLRVGHNYLVACDQSRGRAAKHTTAFVTGIRSALAGRVHHFAIEYSFQDLSILRWLEARIARLPGGHSQFLITHREISDRHKGDRELERALSLLSLTEDAIILVDPVAQTIVDGNEAATRMFGYERARLQEITLESLFVPAALEADGGHGSLLAALPNSHPIETTLQRLDGSVLSAEVRARDVRFREQPLVALVVHDMSRRHRVEALLRRQALQHHLLAQFGQLALEIPPLNVLALRATDILRSGLDVDLCRILTSESGEHLSQIAGAGWEEAWHSLQRRQRLPRRSPRYGYSRGRNRPGFRFGSASTHAC